MKHRIVKLTKKKAFREIIKYGIVGVVGLVIELSIFYILTKKLVVHYPISEQISLLLGVRTSVINVDISHIISSIVAIINNFILNSYFTFKVTNNKLKRFVSFASIAAVGLVFSTTLITIFVGQLGLDEMVAKLLSVFIVAMIQFTVNKFFTFKNKESME